MGSCKYDFYANENIEVSENLVTLSLSSDVSDIDGIARLLSKLNFWTSVWTMVFISSTVATGKPWAGGGNTLNAFLSTVPL